jgi:hypothetical protein
MQRKREREGRSRFFNVYNDYFIMFFNPSSSSSSICIISKRVGRKRAEKEKEAKKCTFIVETCCHLTASQIKLG